jgi:hypothetical protein
MKNTLIPVGGQDIFSSPLCPSRPCVSHSEFYLTSLFHELKSVRSVNLTLLDHQLQKLRGASISFSVKPNRFFFLRNALIIDLFKVRIKQFLSMLTIIFHIEVIMWKISLKFCES